MKEALRQIATNAGCAGFGVTTAAEFNGIAATMHERNDSGFSGRRRFTYKDPDRAADVRSSFPWARSLVVVSWSYLPEAGSPGPPAPGTGRIARFATVDHYLGLRRATDAIREALLDSGFNAEPLVDDDRLVDRAAAVRAGVAWWGKNTMALDPRHGPWLLLGSVVTDAELAPDVPMERDCGTCAACLPSCPTGAIVAPGVLDASKCLAHWLQTAGVFPLELRVPLGDRVYGCDDCLDACPPGRKQLRDVLQVGRIDLFELLAADDATILDRFSHFYIPRRRPRILRRNAILALANSVAVGREQQDLSVPGGCNPLEVGSDRALPESQKYRRRQAGIGGSSRDQALDVIAGYLNGPDEQLRLHSAWAVGRVGGARAVELLEAREAVERVPQVREEIDLALSGLRFNRSEREDPESW